MKMVILLAEVVVMSAPWCPQCGSDMHKKRSGSGWYWWCDKCQCGEEEYDDEGIDYEDRLMIRFSLLLQIPHILVKQILHRLCTPTRPKARDRAVIRYRLVP